MVDDMVALARQEERRLLDELRQIPAYRRLRAVQGLLRAYGVESASLDRLSSVAIEMRPRASPLARTLAARLAAEQASGAARYVRSGSTAAEVIRIAREYLAQTQQRAQTPEIVAEVQRNGFLVGHPNPIATLSAYLSSSPLFDNVRGKGYGLAEWKSGYDSNEPAASSTSIINELESPEGATALDNGEAVADAAS